MWCGNPRDSGQLASMLVNALGGVTYWRQRQKEEPDTHWPSVFAEHEESILRELIALRQQPKYAAMWGEVREILNSLPGARESMRRLLGKSDPKPVAYVDELRDYGSMVKGAARKHGTVWCHLTCAGDCEALHQFAAQIGMKREWAQHFDRDDHYFHHYDLVPSKRELALKRGAVFKPIREQAREFNARRDRTKAIAENPTPGVESPYP